MDLSCLLEVWGNERIQLQLQLVAGREKLLVLMLVHRWRGGAKWLTSQGGGGGGGGSDEPLEAPLGLPLSNYVYV